MQGKVSIVIPCYNASAFIQDTLRSVFSQSYTNYELIVVDDGSTDDSPRLLSDMAHPALRYVFQENQGVSAARNTGLEHATGDYLLFLDADDLLETDFLSARVSALEKDPGAVFACSSVSLISESGQATGYTQEPVCDDVVREICTYAAGHCSCPSNYLIRNLFRKEGLRFTPGLSNSADRFFLLRLSRFGKGVRVTGQSRLLYRIHEGSMSKHIRPGNIKDLMRFYQLILREKLVPSAYYIPLKLKTFRICFSEALLIRRWDLALRSVFSVLLKF